MCILCAKVICADLGMDDLMSRRDPLDGVKAGLQSDKPVPLKSVHVRAKLIDLAAEVAFAQNSLPLDKHLSKRFVLIASL